MEKISGKPVQDFNQLINIMGKIYGYEVEEVVNQENSKMTHNLSTLSEENNEDPLWSPHSGQQHHNSQISEALLSVSQVPPVAPSIISCNSGVTKNSNQQHIFPTPAEMQVCMIMILILMFDYLLFLIVTRYIMNILYRSTMLHVHQLNQFSNLVVVVQ